MSLAVDARLRDRSEAFGREIVALGESLRQAAGPADLRHLRRIDVIGRVCGFAGLGTAWLCPNPLSAGLLAVSMMVRFVIGHQVGHGSYDRIDGVPARYTRKVFARGWRCYVDWLDWWRHEDWLFTHHQLHHANTQTPVDTDVMDSRFVAGRPYWVRVMWLAVMMASWKFTYYPPRLCRNHRSPAGDNDAAAFGGALTDPAWHTMLWRDYVPYAMIRFALPAILVMPIGGWAAVSMVFNLVLAELFHNAHSFCCIRPSHCAADIPLFAAPARNREEFYLQSVLGTVNYSASGEIGTLLQGWQNYQIEHHLWPTATLLQYRLSRTRLQAICLKYEIPYAEGPLPKRFLKMTRLFMGVEHQRIVDLADLQSRPPAAVT